MKKLIKKCFDSLKNCFKDRLILRLEKTLEMIEIAEQNHFPNNQLLYHNAYLTLQQLTAKYPNNLKFKAEASIINCKYFLQTGNLDYNSLENYCENTINLISNNSELRGYIPKILYNLASAEWSESDNIGSVRQKLIRGRALGQDPNQIDRINLMLEIINQPTVQQFVDEMNEEERKEGSPRLSFKPKEKNCLLQKLLQK